MTAWTDGAIATYDVLTRTPIGCRRLRDAATTGRLGELGTGPLVLGAGLAFADDGSSAPGRERLYLLVNSARVLSVALDGGKARTELDESDIPGVPTMLRASTGTLAVATTSGVLAWSLTKRRPIAFPLGGLTAAPNAISMRFGQVLIAGPDGTALVPTTAHSGGRSETLPRGGPATVAGVGGDHTIVTGGPGGRLSMLTDSRGALVQPPTDPTRALAFTADGSLLLSHWFSGLNWGLYTTDPRHPPARGTAYRHLRDFGGAVTLQVSAVAWSPSYVAAAGRLQDRSDGAVRVWTADGRTLWTIGLRPGTGPIVAVAFAPGMLLARAADGALSAWSTGTWRPLSAPALGPGDTRRAAPTAASGDTSGEPAMEVRGTEAVLTEGAGASRRLLRLGLRTGTVVRQVAEPGATRISADAAGDRVAALIGDRIQVRDAAFRPLARLRLPPGARASDLAMSPDGRRVAVAQGSRVLVYDVTTQTQAMPALQEADDHEVVRLAWSPDGSLLAGTTWLPDRGAHDPGPANLWTVRNADWTDQICRWVGGGLSRADWSRHVGDFPGFIDLCRGVRS